MVGYTTSLGQCINDDSLSVLATLDNESVDLIMTSPPFSLQRHKAYGEVEQSEYVNWLLQFAQAAYPKLKDSGSFVIDIGGAYQKGKPIKSLYPFRFLIRMCDETGYSLAQDFYWHNTSALPAPIEWVNKRKLRCKTAVNTVWWFGKTDQPKSDIRKVLIPYTDRMKRLLKKPEEFYKSGTVRPSGHKMGDSWTNNNGGSIPPNLLQIPNSESNSQYMRHCKELGVTRHPARFPYKLPEFFIKMLTDENDLVVDIFSGSNTTGKVAEDLSRRWLSIDLDCNYVAGSVFRFTDDIDKAKSYYDEISNGGFISLH